VVFEDVAAAQKVLDFDGHFILGKKVAIRNYRKNVKNAKTKTPNQPDPSASLAGTNLAHNEDEDEEIEEVGDFEEEDLWDEAEYAGEPSPFPLASTSVHGPTEAAEELPAQAYHAARPQLFVEQTALGLQPAGDSSRRRFADPNRRAASRTFANYFTESRLEADARDSVLKSYSDHLRPTEGTPAEQQQPPPKYHALYRFNRESSLQLRRRRMQLEAVMTRRAHLYGSYYGL
jgi:hypothetical protein